MYGSPRDALVYQILNGYGRSGRYGASSSKLKTFHVSGTAIPVSSHDNPLTFLNFAVLNSQADTVNSRRSQVFSGLLEQSIN